MGAKSRGNWSSGICLKDCSHQGVEEMCSGCIRFSNLNSLEPVVTTNATPRSDRPWTKKLGPSMRFHPHYNNAFGKYIGTKGEYLSEMKKGGYEPYTGEAKKPTRAAVDTRPTREVLRAIDSCSNRDGSFSPGSVLKGELMRRGVIMSKDAVKRYQDKVNNFTR